MTRAPRLTLFVAILAALLAVPPGAACRADTPPESPPSTLLTPPPRPVSAFFRMPPRTISPAMVAGALPSSPGEACRVAILGAAARHGIPADLMLAISLVESGRTDPATGVRLPWPWTANLDGQDYRFDTKTEAAAWLRQMQARSVASIDTGCMQVNLKHHPDAFASAEEAFDPERNADYAARFLRSLYDGPAEHVWLRAAGFYHSQTPERAAWYQGLVQAALKDKLPAGNIPRVFDPIAGGGGQSLTNHAERAKILPMASGQVGRTLDAYRHAPTLVATHDPRLLDMAALRR